ncbi:MAG: S26 family signal peptidase [Planctomycetota bacterium]
MFGRHREHCDFLAFSLCLIFLFRVFVAEPFEIPTGSMGPTLLGRHKELPCPHCGYNVVVSSSDEIDHHTGEARARIVSAQCPNCGAELDVSRTGSHAGDRIVVLKNPPGEYRRFDVVVFKHVDSPRVYYVKRLVGLPGETVRVSRGEVEVRDPQTGHWQICRKCPEQILATAIPVYDDRHAPKGEPPRWVSNPQGSWERKGNAHVLSIPEGSGSLVYRHVPHPGSPPRLITDDLGFNSALTQSEWASRQLLRSSPGHPVGDLLLSFHLELTDKSERFAAELHASIDTARWEWSKDNNAFQMTWNGKVVYTASLPFLPVKHEFVLGNVDKQLLLWMDGELLARVSVESQAGIHKGPSENDLHPATIEAAGLGTTISDLVLLRDIYYTRQSQASDFFRPAADVSEMDRFLAEPSRWKRLRDIRPQSEPWTLGPGEYVALGDNSQQSNDSRHWRYGPKVKDGMILGRAEFLLWPFRGYRFGRIH